MRESVSKISLLSHLPPLPPPPDATRDDFMDMLNATKDHFVKLLFHEIPDIAQPTPR